MVEGVEALQTELKCIAFLERESFEQSKVRVKPARKAQRVALAIAEGQTDRQRVGQRIVKQLPKRALGGKCCLHRGRHNVWISDCVRERGDSYSVCYATIVCIRRAVCNREW